MKQAEIVKLSDTELVEYLAKFRLNYSDLKSAHVVSSLENPLEVRSTRRSIARILTEMSNRGINA